MKRRQFIGFTAISGIGMTAGCLGSESDTYATVQRLVLINERDEAVTMELGIERDDTDEVLHEDMYEIGS